MTMRNLTYILILAALLCACVKINENTSAPIPRPEAYQRVEPYGDSTVTACVDGLAFSINANADTLSKRPDWLNIVYPRYNATIYITVRHMDNEGDLYKAVGNRMMRMQRNAGANQAEMASFDNKYGFQCGISTCPGSPTPVQFVAFDKKYNFISGVAHIDGPCMPVDSMQPTFEALEAAVDTLLKTVRPI